MPVWVYTYIKLRNNKTNGGNSMWRVLNVDGELVAMFTIESEAYEYAFTRPGTWVGSFVEFK